MNIKNFRRLWWVEINERFFCLIKDKDETEARQLVDEYNALTGKKARLCCRR